MKRHFIWTGVLAALVVAASVSIVEIFQRAEAADSQNPVATYARGTLHLTIPYRSGHSGAGVLTAEVLDPEDRVLGHLDRRLTVEERTGTWQEDLALTKALPIEDLVWHRLRYRFAFADRRPAIEATQSISQILRMPVMHILGQQSYLSGGAAGVRVVVTDANNDPVPGAATIRIELLDTVKPRVLFTGPLNRRGTAEAQFRFPAGLVGSYPLRYAAETSIGSTEFTQQIRLEDKVSILLTTEKPLYQPGQTIHLRALALDRSNHEAAARRKLTFELEDPRGNKVFKKAAETDDYGIASAEFSLADEVNLGTYHLRALMSANRAEVALNVERYVLPKFKVAVDFSGKARHGYRPGDHVTGTVRANYFFGKPMDGAEITVKASGMDVARFDAGSVQGKTDSEGAYRFDLALPAYFAGRPVSQGAARVLIEASVKDAAGHAETRGEPITVSESPLLVTAIPESGRLIPNLENQVYVLISYADGKPAPADLRVRAAGTPDQNVTTDAGGVAVVRVKAGGAKENLQVEASDKEGNRATASIGLETRPGAEQILLRSERAVYRAGDRILIKLLSTTDRGTAYVDVVKDGQTVWTRDVDIVNGQAEMALTATAEMAGTLDFSAYRFGRDAQPIADHRLVFVQPADELKVEAAAELPVYRPGDDARIRFQVTNARGQGVQAALGLQVVDEAVFALAEKQPGLAKVFFYLEQEVMKPRYEIHSIGLPDLVQPVEAARAAERDRAARALFAATEMVNANRFETELGRSVPQAKYAEYAGRFQTRFLEAVRQGLTRAYAQNGGDVTQGSGPDLRDPWGGAMRVDRASWVPGRKFYTVRSAGPDRRFDTADDLMAYAEMRPGNVVAQPRPDASDRLDIQIEHERGPFHGLAEIAGSIVDPTGAGLRDVRIEARDAGGNSRTARSNADGQFSLAALPAGRYQLQVSLAGFRTAAREVNLAARDRAVLSATLQVGAVADAVIVEMQGRAFAGGVLGGIGGAVAAGFMQPPPVRMEERAALPLRRAEAVPSVLPVNSMIVTKDAAGSSAPRVRSYFPEALYINPEIITDHNGGASISIPLADSITNWRLAMVASTMRGALGSGASSIKVFQDFFVDLDLPVTLTQGDRVSLPVAVYNYSGARGEVDLKLQAADWYSLANDAPEKTLAVDAGRVGAAQYTLEAKRIGKFKLTLAASMKGAAARADIVVREIEVVPNGREQTLVFNGRLDTSVQHDVTFPAASIPDASRILVRLYPGPLSQVIEGMDAILRMPGGCFEQTSSSTYPNVLALDYMKRTGKLTPEVHAKAEGFIGNGYQRLLTFEVPGGGFSWFGSAPANKILTAYGLMEFYDMSKVHEVDANVIRRTQQWLAGQQQADGSWKPDTSFINEGATNRFNTDLLRITSYIAWSLENTGYQGPAVERARQYIGEHWNAKMDAYTLAVVANFAADYGKDREFTRQAIERLMDARTEKDEQASWTAEETAMFGAGASATVETTGLAVQALLKWGEASTTASKALNFLASRKNASGSWGTTQATIMALRAVLLSTGKGAADVRGAVEISLNGKTVERLTLTPENNDLLHQFVFSNVEGRGANRVELRFAGKGGLAYQVAGRYFVPWTERPAREPLSIEVTYDRTTLSQDDIATVTATLKNNLGKAANMVMIDLGIPPGFDLLSEDLQAYQEKSGGQKSGRLEKFQLTATQAILYFDSIASGDTLTLRYRLRAKYPVRARTFASRVYEYYDPDVNAVARPVQLEVRKR